MNPDCSRRFEHPSRRRTRHLPSKKQDQARRDEERRQQQEEKIFLEARQQRRLERDREREKYKDSDDEIENERKRIREARQASRRNTAASIDYTYNPAEEDADFTGSLYSLGQAEQAFPIF